MEENRGTVWLNDLFLKEVLQSVEETKEPLTIVKYWSEAAVPPGVNYLSLLYRVGIEYTIGGENKTQSKTLIVKTPLESGHIKEIVEKSGGYAREVKIYGQVLPKMYELLDCDLTPKSYVCPMLNSLTLEDLRAKGYTMADRLKQLDLACCKLTMQTLAKFHALSIALHKKEPILIEDGTDFEKEDKEFREKLVKSSLKAVLATLKELAGCEKYTEMIQSRKDTLKDELEENLKLTSDGWNVLCHGDLWTTNVLFKHTESGEVVDAKFIDFQLSKYRPFAVDIIFFWISSADKDVRDNHREEVFETYRQQLNQTLEDLRCKERLTKEVFDEQIRRMAPFAIVVLSGMLPMFMADPDDLMDMNTLSKPNMKDESDSLNDELFMKNYRSKYYRALLPQVLRQAEQLGAFY